MNTGNLNLFIKMVKEDYALNDEQLVILGRRLLADDREFEKVWKQFKDKGRKTISGVDPFKFLLQELLN